MSFSGITLQQRDKSASIPASTLVSRGRTGGNSINGQSMGTFTGQVWLDVMLKYDTVTMVNVNFQPCARTNWHKHEGGQLLHVTGGSGWVCDQGGQSRRITVGDVVWCPPGGVHWHGADEGTFMVHEATSFGGIDWYEPVSEQEYSARG